MNRAEASKLMDQFNDARKNLKYGHAAMCGILEVCIEVLLNEDYSRKYAEEFVVEEIEKRIAKWSATPPEPGSYNALFNTQNHDNATAPVPPITDLAANTVSPVSDRQ